MTKRKPVGFVSKSVGWMPVPPLSVVDFMAGRQTERYEPLVEIGGQPLGVQPTWREDLKKRLFGPQQPLSAGVSPTCLDAIGHIAWVYVEQRAIQKSSISVDELKAALVMLNSAAVTLWEILSPTNVDAGYYRPEPFPGGRLGPVPPYHPSIESALWARLAECGLDRDDTYPALSKFVGATYRATEQILAEEPPLLPRDTPWTRFVWELADLYESTQGKAPTAGKTSSSSPFVKLVQRVSEFAVPPRFREHDTDPAVKKAVADVLRVRREQRGQARPEGQG